MVLLAPQPASTERNRRQLDALLRALQDLGDDWGAVVAPHPAQRRDAYQDWPARAPGQQAASIVLAPPGVGASQCLAAADVLVTEYSTCAMEAMLLDLPVVELSLPPARSLRLAEHSAAISCSTPTALAPSIRQALDTPAVSAAVKREIGRWDGRSAGRVADVIGRLIA